MIEAKFQGFRVIDGGDVLGRPVRYLIGKRRSDGEWDQLAVTGVPLDKDEPEMARFLREVEPVDQHLVQRGD